MNRLDAEVYLAQSLRRHRGWHERTQDDVADAMRALGHDWSRTTVAKIETDARAMHASELLALLSLGLVQLPRPSTGKPDRLPRP